MLGSSKPIVRRVVYVNVHVFFFQAEDGIRDYKVTGVQTCALPILVNYSTFGSTLTNAGDAPTAVTVGAVYITSITVTYGTVGGSLGYELDASSTKIGRASCRGRV